MALEVREGPIHVEDILHVCILSSHLSCDVFLLPERELVFHKHPIKEEIVKNSKLIAHHAIKKFEAI